MKRLTCWLRGHAYSEKMIVPGEFVSVTMATCDRCGEGEAELARFRCRADEFYRERRP